jgi:hypothetical protein
VAGHGCVNPRGAPDLPPVECELRRCDKISGKNATGGGIGDECTFDPGSKRFGLDRGGDIVVLGTGVLPIAAAAPLGWWRIRLDGPRDCYGWRRCAYGTARAAVECIATIMWRPDVPVYLVLMAEGNFFALLAGFAAVYWFATGVPADVPRAAQAASQ